MRLSLWNFCFVEIRFFFFSLSSYSSLITFVMRVCTFTFMEFVHVLYFVFTVHRSMSSHLCASYIFSLFHSVHTIFFSYPFQFVRWLVSIFSSEFSGDTWTRKPFTSVLMRKIVVAGQQACRRFVRRPAGRAQPHLLAGSSLGRASCKYSKILSLHNAVS